MKRLAIGAPLIVALSLTLLVTGRAEAQVGRGGSRSGRLSPPPPAISGGLRTPSTAITTSPSREMRLPPVPRTMLPFAAHPFDYVPRYLPQYGVRPRPVRPFGSRYGYYGYYGYGYPGYAYPGYFGYGGSDVPYSSDDLSVGAPGGEESNIDSPFATASAESLGRLFFDTEPSLAQIFVDGIPAGTVADYRGAGMLLTEGVRQVELRAPGYETATFDVNITSQQPAVHRGDLTPLRRTAESGAAVKRGSDKFYLIPGCYLGNRPPSEVSLPPGCDLTQVRTLSAGANVK